VANAGTQFSLVLLACSAGKDKLVAAALARGFGCDEALGRQVLGAAPITLLAGLSAEQALVLREALADVDAAGSRIEIRPGTDPTLPRVGWATPPHIKGRLASEYAGGPATTATLIVPCPYTGQKIRLTISVNVERVNAQDEGGQDAGGTSAQGAVAVAAPVQIPVPALPIPVPVPSPGLARFTPGAGTAAAADKEHPTTVGLPAVPLLRPGPSAHSPGSATRPALSRLTPGPGGISVPPVPTGDPGVKGLEDMVELQPMAEAARPRVAQAPSPLEGVGQAPSLSDRQDAGPTDSPAPGAAQTQSGAPAAGPQPMPDRPVEIRESSAQAGLPPRSVAPLPDIPVLHSAPAPAAQYSVAAMMANQAQAPMPQNLMSAPMDLSAFEANVTASGILKPFPAQAAPPQSTPQAGAQPPAAAAPPPPAGAQPPAAGAQPPTAAPNVPADDGALWSVFMGKSANPKVHQAVAELQGISVEDAARLCQKPVLALAKDVPSAEARSLRQQFAVLNVSVRLTRRT